MIIHDSKQSKPLQDQMKMMRARVSLRAKEAGLSLEGTRYAAVLIPKELRAYSSPMFKLLPAEKNQPRQVELASHNS